MLSRDFIAGALLKELREETGLSPEQVPYALARRDLPLVSGKTIRRIEDRGMVPQVRVKFALANLYGRQVREVWRPKHRAVPTSALREEVLI